MKVKKEKVMSCTMRFIIHQLFKSSVSWAIVRAHR